MTLLKFSTAYCHYLIIKGIQSKVQKEKKHSKGAIFTLLSGNVQTLLEIYKRHLLFIADADRTRHATLTVINGSLRQNIDLCVVTVVHFTLVTQTHF